MTERVDEALAAEVLAGTYSPTALDSCESEAPIDRHTLVVRYVQFTLFANPDQGLRSPAEPEYLIFQQYQHSRGPTTLDQLISPMAKRLSDGFNRGRLPLPDDDEGKETPSLVLEPRANLTRLRSIASTHRIPGFRPGLTADELRPLIETWMDDLRRERISDALDALEKSGHDFSEVLAGDLKDTHAAFNKILKRVFLPEPYQPFKHPYPHFALCAVFEQQWKPLGYTRGELINTISLAPGEQLTLEVHSWDRTTFKSEEELSQETELRITDKTSERDVLSVSREIATQTGAHLDASATVPIKGIPVKLDGGVNTELSTNLIQAIERTSERTHEASQTIKKSRKLRIEVAREVGRETKQTRVVSNTNRCHSINCHYFEVMANYLVTTHVRELLPCLLLPNPKAEITAEWVLCHEDVLTANLMDKAFLPGFDAARLLQAYEAFLEIKREEAKAQAEVSDPVQKELAAHVDAILDSYRKLGNALSKIKKAGKSQDCRYASYIGGRYGWAVCVVAKAGGSIRRLLYYGLLQANDGVIAALDRLKSDKAAAVRAGESLQSFFSTAHPADFQFNPATAAIAKALESVGIPEKLLSALLSWNLIDLVSDDAGLYAAVKAAAHKLEVTLELPPVTTSQLQEEGFSAREIAAARVAFEQLRCHIEDHWHHYGQAMWLHEHPDERFEHLQARGAVASILDNEILGFLGHKSAYPIHVVAAVKPWVDFDALVRATQAELERNPSDPQLVSLPTGGTILETMLGKCDACEDFIQTSRALDLRTQEAKTRQQESEASRFEMRLEQEPPDLSSPALPASGKVVIHMGDEENS